MAGNLSIEACGQVFAPTSRQASSNYAIGSDGRIGMYVEEKDRSWCSSSAANDNRAVTIEVANDGGESTGWHVSNQAMDSLIKLCADICRRNNIEQLRWKADPGLVGHVSAQNMTVHRWFHPTQCPGPYLFSKYGYIADEVNKLLGSPYNPEDMNVPGEPISLDDPSNARYSYVNASSMIDASKITPYIATIHQDDKDVRCKELKNAGVVGLLLYGGSYYTTIHTVNTRYVNPQLKAQAAAAKKYEMPYGLYVSVRARSRAEAKLECNQLWYVVSKYPPQLGIWLKLETLAPKTINDSILEEYYQHFEKWGLKDRCGIYTGREAMKYFTWDNFYTKYLLWLIDPVTDMSQVDDILLTPEFFLLEEVN